MGEVPPGGVPGVVCTKDRDTGGNALFEDSTDTICDTIYCDLFLKHMPVGIIMTVYNNT